MWHYKQLLKFVFISLQTVTYDISHHAVLVNLGTIPSPYRRFFTRNFSDLLSAFLVLILALRMRTLSVHASSLFVLFGILLPFHSSVLKPRFYLCLVQTQRLGKFGAARGIQVFLFRESFLKDS